MTAEETSHSFVTRKLLRDAAILWVLLVLLQSREILLSMANASSTAEWLGGLVGVTVGGYVICVLVMSAWKVVRISVDAVFQRVSPWRQVE